VVGGGFTLLDALLNTVIVPFIPKWLLNLKVLDVLREIGRRVDEKHRRALNAIVEKQAELYVTAFRSLLPSEETMENLLTVRQSLSLNKN
jgi:competence protein ComGC